MKRMMKAYGDLVDQLLLGSPQDDAVANYKNKLNNIRKSKQDEHKRTS